jgi:hypothetical protein
MINIRKMSFMFLWEVITHIIASSSAALSISGLDISMGNCGDSDKLDHHFYRDTIT